jgi:hypothetical protein
MPCLEMNLGYVIGKIDRTFFVVVHAGTRRIGKTESRKTEGPLIQWKDLKITM